MNKGIKFWLLIMLSNTLALHSAEKKFDFEKAWQEAIDENFTMQPAVSKKIFQYKKSDRKAAHSINPSLEKAFDYIEQNEMQALTILLKTEQVPLDEKNTQKDDATLLGFAIDKNKITAINTLLAHGASVNAPSGIFNIPPFTLAIMNKSTEMCDILMNESKLNIDAQSDDGKTALHEAVLFRFNNYIEKLINAGAHVNMRDKNKATPLDLAMCSLRQNLKAAKILREHGAKESSNYMPSICLQEQK